MKTKFLFAAIAAVVGFGLTSCSQDEDGIVSGSNASVVTEDGPLGSISWKSALNNRLSGSTRGTSIQGSNYLNSTLVPNMKVWGFYVPSATGDGISGGAQYVGASGDGIVIKNYSTESPVSNKWDYNDLTQVAYWPSQPLNFYSVIPATDASFTTSGNAITTGNTIAHVTADVTVPTTVTAQKDILFAQAVNQSGRTGAANDPVKFAFDHALTQVVFSGKLASANLSAVINSITICNADQKGTVGFTSDNGTQAVLGSSLAASRAYAKFSAGLVSDATLSGSVNVDNAKNLVATDGALMMIPQDREADVWTHDGSDKTIAQADNNHTTYLAVSCKIMNGDAYVMGTKDAFATVYIPFKYKWVQGKKYTYCLIFGKGTGGYDDQGAPISSLLPIQFTLDSVTDWVEENGGNVEF